MSKFTTLFLLLTFCCTSYSQLTDHQLKKIDELFVDWNKPNHPGGTVGIAIEGKTVFSRAYGLASLEYLIPNSTGTIFNTGSVSKQFTAMAIVRLHEEGKLSIDDDIRKHLPYLHDFGHKITIRHLLHHTSGLRSLHALVSLAGWRGDDLRTNDDLTRLMEKQKDLNFVPGAERLYCNTGYMFIADIVESVTGEKFALWMNDHVFAPLNMPHTYVEDQYNRVVSNNATSYYKRRNEFSRAVEYWGYVGSGNMHSTTKDLLTWLQGFHSPPEGWGSSFEMLETLDNYNDGSPNDYGFGINVVEHLSKKKIHHGGGIGGFRSFVSSYPEINLDIAILTNFSASNAPKLEKDIAEILIGEDQEEKEIEDPSFLTLSSSELQKYEGYYWNENETYSRNVLLKNDTLRLGVTSSTWSENLLPTSKNEFILMDGRNIIVSFSRNDSNILVLKETEPQGRSVDRTMFSQWELSDEVKTQYSGTFYSPEVEAAYQIKFYDDQLKWYHSRHGSGTCNVIKKDVIVANGPLGIIQFSRGDNDEITGIFCSNGRVRNLWFEKK